MVQSNFGESSLKEKSNKDGMIQKNVDVQKNVDIKPNNFLGLEYYLF